LPGAARVSLAEVQLTGDVEWAVGAQVPPALAVEELVAAGLLRRRDVQFVERRRFAAAAAAARAGVARPRNAPAAGVSPGAELLATATLVSLPGARGSIELRLADARTGAVRATLREPLTDSARPVPLARSIVRALLAALEDLDSLPPWEDPSATADGISDGDEVSEVALRSFLRGLAAEESCRAGRIPGGSPRLRIPRSVRRTRADGPPPARRHVGRELTEAGEGPW
jgi:hypothetical protein